MNFFPDFKLLVYGAEIPDINDEVHAFEIGVVGVDQQEVLPETAQNFNAVRNTKQFTSIMVALESEIFIRNGWSEDGWNPVHDHWLVMTIVNHTEGGFVLRMQSLQQHEFDTDYGELDATRPLAFLMLQTSVQAQAMVRTLMEFVRFQWGNELDRNNFDGMVAAD